LPGFSFKGTCSFSLKHREKLQKGGVAGNYVPCKKSEKNQIFYLGLKEDVIQTKKI
jgi:hypothetical protein